MVQLSSNIKGIALMILIFVTPFLLMGCSTGNNVHGQKTIIVAHRGASRLAPENTVASTVLAFEKNTDISEIDVCLSKDNRIMVIHDETTKRTARVDLKVSETDSEKLRELEVGRFKSEVYAGEKIPFIEEIIAVVPEGKKLFIEIKSGIEIVPYLKKAIEDSGKIEQIEIISFDFEALVECKKLMPSVPSYFLKTTKKDNQTGHYPPYDISIIQESVAAGLTGLDLYYEGLTKEFVGIAHQAGLLIFVWTVDDTEVAKTMCEFGVDGITTNVPDVMRSELKL